MPTKITLIYDHPQDPDAFEAAYADQLALAAKMPGIDRLESSKVWPKQDGTPTPAYRLLDLYFTDYDTANDAAATVEAGAFLGEPDTPPPTQACSRRPQPRSDAQTTPSGTLDGPRERALADAMRRAPVGVASQRSPSRDRSPRTCMPPGSCPRSTSEGR
jgi:uncharacterized protein (TIGR02118 family)